MSILVLDVGTSSMRGILYGIGGNMISGKQIKYFPVFSENGTIVEQDPLEFKSALWRILEWAGNDLSGEDVDGICITSQRSSCICLDKYGEPIGNVICWQDKRTVPICRELEAYGDTILKKSGAWVNPVFLGPKLTWIRRNCPEIYERTWKFMTIADYMVFLMTGSTVTDDTYGSRTHLMNLETREWDEELLNIFNIEREKLCDIVPVGSLVGSICEEAARTTGICAGIQVYTAGGDQQCALLGQGVFSGENVSVTFGTGAFIGTHIKKLPENRNNKVIYNAASIAGEYVVEYGAVTCTSALEWLLREVYRGLPADRIGPELAKTEPGAGGCRILPYFQGRVTPDHNSDAKAVFTGISLGTRRENLLRALIEGIGAEAAYGISQMPEVPFRIFIGGGLTGTNEVNQIICNMIGRPLIVNNDPDATALGAFLVAARAMGFYRSEKECYDSTVERAGHIILNPVPYVQEVYQTIKQENLDMYKKIYG